MRRWRPARGCTSRAGAEAQVAHGHRPCPPVCTVSAIRWLSAKPLRLEMITALTWRLGDGLLEASHHCLIDRAVKTRRSNPGWSGSLDGGVDSPPYDGGAQQAPSSNEARRVATPRPPAARRASWCVDQLSAGPPGAAAHRAPVFLRARDHVGMHGFRLIGVIRFAKLAMPLATRRPFEHDVVELARASRASSAAGPSRRPRPAGHGIARRCVRRSRRPLHGGFGGAQRRWVRNRRERGQWRQLLPAAQLEHQQARRGAALGSAGAALDLRRAAAPARIHRDVLHTVQVHR